MEMRRVKGLAGAGVGAESKEGSPSLVPLCGCEAW